MDAAIGKQRPRGAREQPDCQTSWKEAEEKQSLHGGGLEGGHSRLWQLRELGVLTSQWLGCSRSLLKSERAHPQQISKLHAGTEILSPQCVPSARHTAGA